MWVATAAVAILSANSAEVRPIARDLVLNLLEMRSPWPLSWLLKKVFGQVRKMFLNPRNEALLDLMESDLGKQPYFGGENVTGADVTLVYPMYAARDKGTFENGYPNINAWFDRIEARPAFQSARAKDDRERIAFRFSE